MNNHKTIKACVSLFIFFLMLSVEVTATPAGDNIIISEVEYDPATPAGYTSFDVENEAEWFELFNPTANSIDIGGWTIKEGNTPFYTFPAPTIIAAGDYLLVTNRSDRFNLNYPAVTPDLEMDPGGTGLLRLNNNGGDELTLTNDTGTIIDYVAWDGYVAGWTAAAVNGPICRIFNTDTDTGADWEACAATPGTGPGFTLSKNISTLNEGDTDTFTVVLDTQPSSNVVIDIFSDDNSAATVSPTNLTFTAADWNIPQTVTITGVEDDADLLDENVTITASINAAFSDDTFDALIDQIVAVTVADNDTGVGPASIPTLSEWMLIFLSLILYMTGMRFSKQKI